jgi:hypothetical protein
MIKRMSLMLALTLCAMACIHVVVNVYFPESEAKGALASLEDELLRPAPAKVPESPAAQEAPAPKQQGLLLLWFQPAVAHAAGPVSEDQIYQQIKSMPLVLEAYQRMGGRLGRVDALRASGLVGEGSDGLLKVRGTVSDRRDQRTIEEENSDRATVIKGLAKASLVAQGQPANEENLQQVMPGATAAFATLRRERALAGWWVQGADGSWKQK